MSLLWMVLACGGAGETGATAELGQGAEVLADAGEDAAIPVGEALQLDGSGCVGEEIAWDFGDGSGAVGTSPTHSWEAPGHYQAVVEVRGADGSRRSDSATITVYLPPAATAPVHSSTLALDAQGLAWVAVPEAGVVSAVDPLTGSTAEYPVCAGPRTLALDGDRLLVACEEEDALALLDPSTGEVERVGLGVGSRPYGVVARGGVAWLSLQGTGELLRYDGELERVAVGPDPRALAWLPDGRVVASRWRSPEEAAELYVVDGGRWTLPYDQTPDSDTTTGGVPTQLDALAVSPDGGTLYAPGHHANVRRGSWRSGEALTHESALRAVLASVDLSTGEELPRKQFDERGHAGAIALSPLGDYLYVAHPGTRTISVLDAYNLGQSGSLLDVGAAPTGLAVSADGARLYVHAWLEREVRAYDLGELAAGAPLLGAAPTVHSEPLDAELLVGKRLFYESGDPRLADSGYIACAHCHADGRDDGQTWDFTDRGEGLRNTTSLEGRAGTAMGRLHWSGNFDEVQDFEADIRLHFGGSGLMGEADWKATADPLGPYKAGLSSDLDALAAYVSSLERTPPSPHPGSKLGEQLFADQGCADCHPPPLYTDSRLEAPLRHDVGTLGPASGQRLGAELDGLDTPTLLGSWATGPWLHDGSAPTLRDAIAAHASATELGEQSLEELEAFVLGL